MASLQERVRWEADTVREGIGWVIFWRVGRGWESETIWLDVDGKVDPEDMDIARDILAQDANAVMINGYYCAHMGESMTNAGIAAGVRWYYDREVSLLGHFIPDESAA